MIIIKHYFGSVVFGRDACLYNIIILYCNNDACPARYAAMVSGSSWLLLLSWQPWKDCLNDAEMSYGRKQPTVSRATIWSCDLFITYFYITTIICNYLQVWVTLYTIFKLFDPLNKHYININRNKKLSNFQISDV